MVSVEQTPEAVSEGLRIMADEVGYILVTLSLSDEDFGQLVQGKANAQKLFMSGRLKIKGDMMKATKAEPVLKKARNTSKL